MSKAPFVLVTVLGLPIFIAALLFGPAAFDLVFHRRPPERFLIPAGYSGWARVDFRHDVLRDIGAALFCCRRESGNRLTFPRIA